MALAPRASLRYVALLLSNGKPRLSSLFSSAPRATLGNGTPAAPSVKHPAAQGGDALVAPAVQPPPPPAQGSGSTCPQERVLHNKHTEDWTPETLNHKRSPKKHHHRSHKVCEDPDAGVAKGSSFSSSLDNPKHGTPEPTGRARIHGGAVSKPLAHHHRNHKVCEDPDAGVAKGSSFSSSLDNPKHGTPEPTGRARIHGGAVGKPSAYALQKDPKHSVPGASCSTSQPKKHRHHNHKVCEDPEVGVADGSSRSSSLDKPKHPTPEPAGRAGIHGGAVGKPTAYTPQKYPKHSVPGGSCSTSQPLPEKLPKEHSVDHNVREDPVARAPRMSSRDNPGHPVHEP